MAFKINRHKLTILIVFLLSLIGELKTDKIPVEDVHPTSFIKVRLRLFYQKILWLSIQKDFLESYFGSIAFSIYRINFKKFSQQFINYDLLFQGDLEIVSNK